MKQQQFNSITDADAVSEASGVGPLVHPQETSTPFDYGATYRTFLASGQPQALAAGDDLYSAIDDRDGTHRLGDYRRCRTVAWFVRHKTTRQIRVASSRCGLRWCPLCVRTKRFVMTQSIIPWIQKRIKPKFITLTLAHSSIDLNDQIDRLYNAFRLLRRSKLWKNHISGGLWFFQVKRSATDGNWHPHIHIIAVGKFLPRELLSARWLKCTGDSMVTDIRAVKSAKKTADYVARYATAPAVLHRLDQADRIELFDCLHGRRICGTFGSGREIQLAPKKCPDAEDWENIGSYFQVISFRHNDDAAAAIYQAWRDHSVTDATMIKEKPPPAIDEDARWHEPLTYKQHLIEWNLKP